MSQEFTNEELKDQIEDLEDELEALDEKQEALEKKLKVAQLALKDRQKPTDFNLWDEYYKREDRGMIPPQLAIPGNLEYNDAGWAFDGGDGFFFKPLNDLRAKFAASSDRVEKFASQYILDFHRTYLCLPEGFTHSDEYTQWFNRNYDQAQRKRLMFGLGRIKFRVKPVYDSFVGIDEANDWSWATDNLPDYNTRRFNMGLIWGGNVGVTSYNGITASLAAFEKYWTGKQGANRVKQLTSNELIIMDRQYKSLGTEARAEYVASHPGYVPVI